MEGETKEKNKQKRSELDPETMKIQGPGAVLEPFGDPLGRLGVSGGASSDFWRDLVEIFGEVGANMGPRWTQARWAKLAASCAQDEPRWPCWAQFESFWGDPGSTFGNFFCDL